MKTILLVNNDFDTMSLIKRWLEIKGYKVRFTDSRREALRLMKECKPSLVIIDILQHVVLFDIKAQREFDHVPILLMTGYTSTYTPKKLPADDSIEKPFDLPLFERKIKALLDHKVEA